MLRVKKGYAIYYFCFDIGDEVRLDQAERLAGAKLAEEVSEERLKPAYMHYRAPPLYLALGLSQLAAGHLYHGIDILVSLHLLAAAVGMYVLLRRLRINPAISALAGLLWITYPYVVHTAKGGIVFATLALYLPLNFLLLESLLKQPRLGTALWLAVTKALLFYAGYPQHSFMIMLFETLLLVAVANKQWERGWHIRAARMLAAYSVALVAAALLSAPLLLPLITATRQSFERAGPISIQTVANPAVTLAALFRAQLFQFQPWFLAISTQLLYIGLPSAILLLPLVIPSIRKQAGKYRATRYLLLALTALALSSSLYAYFYPLPLFNRFIGPYKYFQFFIFFVTVALAGTAQGVLDQFKTRRAAPVLLLFALAVFLNIATIQRQPLNVIAPHVLDVPPRLEALATIKPEAGRVFTVGRRAESDSYRYVTYNYATLFGYDHVGGFDALRSRVTNELALGLNIQNVYRSPLTPSLLDYLSSWNVRYIVSDHELATAELPQLNLLSAVEQVYVYENTRALPLVRDPARPDQAVPYRRGVNGLEMYPVTDEPHTLVVAIAALPNWTYAINDGRARWVTPAAGPIELAVPAGTDKVIVEYVDRQFIKGVVLFMLFWLVVGILYAAGKLRAGRKTH